LYVAQGSPKPSLKKTAGRLLKTLENPGFLPKKKTGVKPAYKNLVETLI